MVSDYTLSQSYINIVLIANTVFRKIVDNIFLGKDKALLSLCRKLCQYFDK